MSRLTFISTLLSLLVGVSTLAFVVVDSGYRKEANISLRAAIQDNEDSEIVKWVNLEAVLEEMSTRQTAGNEQISREVQRLSRQELEAMTVQTGIIRNGVKEFVAAISSRLDEIVTGADTRIDTIVAGMNARLDTLENTEIIRQREIFRLASQFAALADEEYAKGNYLSAIKDYQRAWEIDSEPSAYPLGYALSLRASGLPSQSDKIRSALETVLHKDPYNEKALALYYRMAIESNDNESALVYGTRLSRIRPQDPELSYWLGHILKSRGHYREAVTYLKIAYQGQVNNTGAIYALGESLTSLRRYDEAEEILRNSLEEGTPNIPTLQWLGRIYYETGRYSLAITEWKKIVAVRPSAKIYNQIAQAWYISGDNSKARQYWEAAIDSVSIHSKADSVLVAGFYASITRIYIEKKKWNTARKYCNIGLSILRTPELRKLLETINKGKMKR